MISIRGARQHNLKNISLNIPKGGMTAIVGVSGSGKSSLAFDTIYAEGYRRYMDSLSIQARTFMEQMPRPNVDAIDGLSPAVAISQRVTRPSPRTTVASVTEIHAYLRLLFAHEGTPYCPGCGNELRAYSRAAIIDRILSYPESTRIILLAPLVHNRRGDHSEVLRAYAREGFVRLRINGVYTEVADVSPLEPDLEHIIEGVIDRIIVRPGIRERVADSVETALRLGSGILQLEHAPDRNTQPAIEYFGVRASCPTCRIALPEIRPSLFSSNSISGMCRHCDGLGYSGSIPEDSVITAPEKGILDGALGPLNSPSGVPRKRYLAALKKFLRLTGIATDKPVSDYDAKLREALLYGLPDDGELKPSFEGVIPFLRRLRSKELNEEQLSCPTCNGSGLRSEAMLVKLNAMNIAQLCERETRDVLEFLDSLTTTAGTMKPVVEEIRGRLKYMQEVGLGYLSLDRKAATLSGGELQRIRLATQVGSRLSGVIYVLDEPTIGLHPKDTRNLIVALKRFLERGNTVIVVEHNREVMAECGHVVELGPGAGDDGGKIVFEGGYKEIAESEISPTGAFLSGRRAITVKPSENLTYRDWIRISGANRHNLKNIEVAFPVGGFTSVVGPSGAGKSTLAVETLLPFVRKGIEQSKMPGDFHGLHSAVLVDPLPLKRSGRSNISTYLDFARHIRFLFSLTPEAKMRGYDASRFSTNIKSGRCESCNGSGEKRLEMVFMPDVYIPCEDCSGTGFTSEVLEIRFKGMNYADIMAMEVSVAEKFFASVPKIRKPLRLLREIGLGYLKLGQSAATFSGGEAQRVKLAAGLVGTRRGSTLFVLDEPTIGLHFLDVERLLQLIRKLSEFGHTIIVVEHDPEFIANSDYVIELGPGGGNDGGHLIAEGTPRQVANMVTLTGRELEAFI